MSTVNDYVNSHEGLHKEWLGTFVEFMCTTFPDLQETISYQMPTYKFDGQYIAFSVAQDHFTFHTLDFDMIEELKTLLPKAKFGKGSAKVRYDDKEAIPTLFEMAKKIVARSRANPGKKTKYSR
jgi:uncharacterized protein YdhG (YjbR/CyaY superfamily)